MNFDARQHFVYKPRYSRRLFPRECHELQLVLFPAATEAFFITRLPAIALISAHGRWRIRRKMWLTDDDGAY